VNLRRLFIINAVATFAAGVVLFLWPELIPGTIGIHLQPSAYLLCYLLGASELAMAALCFFGVTLREPAALQAVVITFIVFHAASGLAGAMAVAQGAPNAVWWNVALRGVMILLFIRYGLLRRIHAD
jgi:hypothetical protein